MGQVDEAVASLEMAVARSRRHVWSTSNLARAMIAANRLDEARLLVDELERRTATEPVPAYALLVRPYLADPVDDREFFRLLDRWREERGFWNVMLNVEPAFDDVRNDPRFKAAVGRVGIPGR